MLGVEYWATFYLCFTTSYMLNCFLYFTSSYMLVFPSCIFIFTTIFCSHSACVLFTTAYICSFKLCSFTSNMYLHFTCSGLLCYILFPFMFFS